MERDPHFANITKFSLDRYVLCDALDTKSPNRAPNDGFIERLAETRAFGIGRYAISPTTKQPSLGFGYPLIDDQGQVNAVLIFSVKLTSLNDLFENAQLPPNSTLTLRDENGTILSRYPDPENWVGKKDPNNEILERMRGGSLENTFVAKGLDGLERLHAFIPLRATPESDVFLSVSIPQAVAYAKVTQTLFRNLAALGLVGVLAIALAWFFSNVFFLRQINAILEATKQLASGKYGARTNIRYEVGELGELAKHFNEMGEALENHEREMQEVQTALRQEEHARATLLHQVITVQEEERRRIARELHDETSQRLAALMLGCNTLELAVRKDPEEAKEHFASLKGNLEGMLVEIHRLINDLRPSSLDDLGLKPAILSYGEQRLKPDKIELQLFETGISDRLPLPLETAIFRIIQESFTNTILHSKATRVNVWLTRTDGNLEVLISDNGSGFDPSILIQEGVGARFGLLGMQERIRMLDGTFELNSAPGEGTLIRINVPLPRMIDRDE